MLTFKKLTLDDIDTVYKYFELTDDRICDNTIGGTFMWRDFFKTEYTVYNGTLILKVVYLDGRTAYAMPTGKDVRGALRAIYGYCGARGDEAVICVVTAEDLEIIKEDYDIEYRQETDWSDYLYNADDLKYFQGHKYNGQRNHINHFKNEYPDYRTEVLGAENIPKVIEFFDKFSASEDKASAVFREERDKVYEVLENYGIYRQTGIVIFVNGEVIAFAAGEAINDTLYEHIEKADHAYQGAYQITASEFARACATEGVKYINREEDVGDEGLRISKLSYHPCRIIEKYVVDIKKAKKI